MRPNKQILYICINCVVMYLLASVILKLFYILYLKRHPAESILCSSSRDSNVQLHKIKLFNYEEIDK